MTFGYELEPGSRSTTWGTVSSGFREIEIGWNLWGFLPHFLPQPAAPKTQEELPGVQSTCDFLRPIPMILRELLSALNPIVLPPLLTS